MFAQMEVLTRPDFDEFCLLRAREKLIYHGCHVVWTCGGPNNETVVFQAVSQKGLDVGPGSVTGAAVVADEQGAVEVKDDKELFGFGETARWILSAL